jgi:hypothetical protein
VLHEKVLAEYRTEATGEPDRSTAVLCTNYSWHWDGQNPAGNPIQIATLSHSAQASLLRNEFDLLAEALSSTGRPLRHAVGGARPPPSTRLLALAFLSAPDYELLLRERKGAGRRLVAANGRRSGAQARSAAPRRTGERKRRCRSTMGALLDHALVGARFSSLARASARSARRP